MVDQVNTQREAQTVDRQDSSVGEAREAFRRSVGFQMMFYAHSGLEMGKAIDHICAAGDRMLAACALALASPEPEPKTKNGEVKDLS